MNKYVAQLQQDTGATLNNIVEAGVGRILVAEVKINESDEIYIDATVEELAAADVVVIKHISAGDPNVPTSEFGVVYGTCELIMNNHGVYLVIVSGDVFFSTVGYNQFVATDASQKPVGYTEGNG